MARPTPGTAGTVGDTATATATVQSYTTQAGETYLVVRVGMRSKGTSVSSVTFGATGLSQLIRQAGGTGGSEALELWAGVVAASTTADVTVTYAGTNTNACVAIQAYAGVDTGGTPVGTAVGAVRESGSGTGTLSVDVTDSTADALVIDALISGATDGATIGGGQSTEFTAFHDGAGQCTLRGSKEDGTAGTITMSWTSVGVANGHVQIAAVAVFGTGGGGGGGQAPRSMQQIRQRRAA